MNHQWTISGVSDLQSGPTHTFGTAGSYPITETVTDEFGAPSTKSVTVSVLEAPLAGVGSTGSGGVVFYLIAAIAAIAVVGVTVGVVLGRRGKSGPPPVR